jgi:hypothetical protein
MSGGWSTPGGRWQATRELAGGAEEAEATLRGSGSSGSGAATRRRGDGLAGLISPEVRADAAAAGILGEGGGWRTKWGHIGCRLTTKEAAAGLCDFGSRAGAPSRARG